MALKKYFYMVGNAHLDPVWQWRWQEGSAEAKATVRSALDRMNEDPEFVFVCSSMSVYRWIKEFAPEMFEEVRKRVKEGRFKVTGGMYVQPDCNNPSGEGFARQLLYSQRWFHENLGVTADTGYNVDSFGHNLSLPQILRRAGLKNYIFMRPGEHEKHLDTELFHWTSPDGSEVLTTRIFPPYCGNFNSLEELEAGLEARSNQNDCGTDCAAFFYGVGNHGGGPTRQNLALIHEAARKHPESRFIFSDLTDYFDHIRSEEAAGSITVPALCDELQHHASGCYSAVLEIKEGIRKAECALLSAEKFSLLANRLLNVPYPDFERAWLDVCFCHFHDIMGGCCTRDACSDTAYMYGEAQAVAARAQNTALQALSWQIGTDAPDSPGTPIVIFNPHPWPVEQEVRVNAQLSAVSADGQFIPIQHVRSQTHSCMQRFDTIFRAQLPPLGWKVFRTDEKVTVFLQTELKPELFEAAADRSVQAFISSGSCGTGGGADAGKVCGNGTAQPAVCVLQNSLLRIEFDLKTGFVRSMKELETGRELIEGSGAVPIVIDETGHDTWSHGKNFFDRRIGTFGNAELTVLESGPVRATVKVVSKYADSRLTQYFSLGSGERKLRVEAVIDFQEKHRMVKYGWNFALTEPRALYEIPFGSIERPADGEEEPGLKWAAVAGNEFCVGLANNGRYSYSVRGGELCVTAVRTPIYGDHGGPRDAESEYTDLGVTRFTYEIIPQTAPDIGALTRAAEELNQPAVNILENRHPGPLPEQFSGLACAAANITVSALKLAEDGDGMILRAVETDGRSCTGRFTGPVIGGAAQQIEVPFAAHEIKTLRLDGRGSWKEVLITEFDI